jgi:hypothetical protein
MTKPGAGGYADAIRLTLVLVLDLQTVTVGHVRLHARAGAAVALGTNIDGAKRRPALEDWDFESDSSRRLAGQNQR